MEQPMSPTAQGFDLLNLTSLAKTTNKTFERLAPFCELQNPSSTEATPIVTKIVGKMHGYTQAIESSILAVGVAYRLSNDAASLCDLIMSEKNGDATEPDAAQRKRLTELVILASEAYEKAERASSVFRQAEQDLYKIAALTKDNPAVVDIPIDPPHPKTIRKPLEVVGSDLVANLNLLAEFYQYTLDFTNWCRWVKGELTAAGGSTATSVIPALDGTAETTYVRSIRLQWSQMHDDCLVYYSTIRDMQSRYPSLLSDSRASWRSSMGEAIENKTEETGRARKFTHKASNIIRDAVRLLACHGCCFA